MIKDYYQLAKPGIIYGNLISALAGFFLAEHGNFNIKIFLAMAIGLSLIIASACVFNNMLDADIDKKMERTKVRPIPQKKISKHHAFVYGGMLLIIGSVVLINFTNILTFAVALIGFIFYTLIYTPAKRVTPWATIIGAIPGATPPVVGYTAITGHFDLAALLLFLILFFWQMPHFYAIAIYRMKDYAQAGIPVLPIKKGVKETKVKIILYIMAFTVAAAQLSYYKFTGYTFAVTAIILGLIWLVKATKGFNIPDQTKWAKDVFLFSLIVLTTTSAVIAFNHLFP